MIVYDFSLDLRDLALKKYFQRFLFFLYSNISNSIFSIKFQRSTDTRINFKDKNLNIETDKSDKIVVIRGLNVNVAKAEMEIKRFIFEMPTTRTEEYFIPENICGKIIGRGGANIRDMTKKSNCKIKLNDKGTNDPSKETDEKNVKNIIEAESNDDWTFKKIVKLTGTEDEINAAKVTNLILNNCTLLNYQLQCNW